MAMVLTPYLVVRDAPAAIDFYSRAFGAKELLRLVEPGGKVGHAELDIDGAPFYLADEYPDFGFVGPATTGNTTVSLHLNVPDVDAVVAKAVAEGATILRPIKNEFYGDRAATIQDPFGHRWQVTMTVERISLDEMKRRFGALFR